MIKAESHVQLSPEHKAYHLNNYETLEESEFIEMICNEGQVLPTYKLDAAEHLQCCWLGAALDPSQYVLFPDYLREQRRNLGWRPIRYMLILPSPSNADLTHRTALHPKSAAGKFMRKELHSAGIPLSSCVATHVCRFALPRTLNKYSQRHKKDCQAYLHADIAECKPDVIITFGADSLKSLFGNKAKMDTYQGNILDYVSESGHVSKVIPSYSHLSFLGGHAEISVFRAELRRAMELGEGIYSRKAVKKDYRVCKTAEEVEDLCNHIRQVAPPWVSFDTEFGNQCAREEHTETISIQLSWGAGTGAFIQLTDQIEVFKPNPPPREFQPPALLGWEAFCEKKYKNPWSWFIKHPDAAVKCRAAFESKNQRELIKAQKTHTLLIEQDKRKIQWRQFHEYHYEFGGKFYKAGQPMHSPEDWHRIWYSVQQLLLDRKWKICAHHLRTDCDQFGRNGYPIEERIEDGIDTMLIHHLLYGDESQGLDHVVRKYLPHYGAFWMELEEYLEDTGHRRQHLKFGYRDIPFKILIPYALCDSDTTWQAAEHLLLELSSHPRLKQLYFKHVNPTSWHIYQIERQGILIDEVQRAKLHDAYEPVYSQMLTRVRDAINWPSFNPGSDEQLKTLLFYGCVYKNPKPPPPQSVGCAPPITLGLEPIFNTDKYPKNWAEVVNQEEEVYNTPSVGAEALDLLYSRYNHQSGYEEQAKLLKMLKHLSVVGKFLSTYLSPQVANEFGVPEDGKSFQNNIWRDGRVRTRLSQLTATGRYTSSKANLQTKPKKQEAAAFAALVDFYFGISAKEYKARIDPEYEGADRIEERDQITVPKFASCFIAKPGYCLIEADFSTAEVFIWAYSSGDTALIKLVDSGRDSHSENTLRSFKLPELEQLAPALIKLEAGDRADYDKLCEEVKAKYGALRIAAKSVLFGIMYGRGATALAREINKVVDDPVSVEDTERIITGISEAYPVAWEWLITNSDGAVELEYVENAFGRRRYFQGASQMSEWDQAAVRREAKNSPIQGAVADLLAQAGFNLHRIMRKLRNAKRALGMEILLPIHDAFLFEVKIEEVPKVLPLIEVCMATKNCLPDTNYHLDIDVEIFPERWSDKAYDPHKPGQLDAFMDKYATAA